MAKLLYGGYTFSITPTVSLRRSETLRNQGGERIGTVETWVLRGYLKGADETDLKTKSDSLSTAFATDSQDLKLTSDNGQTTLESMLASDVERGPQVTRVDFPDGPAAWVTNRPFEITVRGEKYGDNNVLETHYSDSYVYDNHGVATRSRDGFVRTRAGVSASGQLSAVAPALPAGWQRERWEKRLNLDDTRADFVFVDRQLWKTLPENVTGGGYTTDSVSDDNGVTTVTIAGNFTGTGARDAALNLLPQEPLIVNRLSVNEYDGSADFQFVYRQADPRGLLYGSETVVYQPQRRDFILHGLFNGGLERQDAGVVPAVVVQSGFRVGKYVYPIPELPFYPQNIKEERHTRESPKRSANGNPTEYKINWHYVFEMESDPGNVCEPATL